MKKAYRVACIPREASQTELFARGPETQSGKLKPRAKTPGTVAARLLSKRAARGMILG
jgi:hypothetical protein